MVTIADYNRAQQLLRVMRDRPRRYTSKQKVLSGRTPFEMRGRSTVSLLTLSVFIPDRGIALLAKQSALPRDSGDYRRSGFGGSAFRRAMASAWSVQAVEDFGV
jgi:hypothetical protein